MTTGYRTVDSQHSSAMRILATASTTIGSDGVTVVIYSEEELVLLSTKLGSFVCGGRLFSFLSILSFGFQVASYFFVRFALGGE